jgi:hypothetical protein
VDVDEISNSHSRDFVFGLACRLKDPSAGDMELIFAKNEEDVDDTTPRLYTFSHALKPSAAFDNFCIELLLLVKLISIQS